MASKKHKAPTQVTLVQEEKSAFAQWVEKNWRMGAIVATVVTAGILFRQVRGQQAVESRDAVWSALLDAQGSGEPAEIVKAAETSLVGTGLEAWAYLSAAQLSANRRDYDQALDATERMARTSAPLLAEFALPIGPEGTEVTIAEAMKVAILAQKSQDETLASKFVNPAPPDDAPRVALEVDVAGSTRTITIALYSEQAPKHVENFLAQVEAGTYDGVKFHQVIDGFKIQTGNPLTRTADVSQWGDEDPATAEDGVEKEDSDLIHGPMSVSSPRTAARGTLSSKSQFYIATERGAYDQDQLDVVFGAVVEGQDVVLEIEALEVRPFEPEMPPYVPVEPVPTIVSAKRVDG